MISEPELTSVVPVQGHRYLAGIAVTSKETTHEQVRVSANYGKPVQSAMLIFLGCFPRILGAERRRRPEIRPLSSKRNN